MDGVEVSGQSAVYSAIGRTSVRTLADVRDTLAGLAGEAADRTNLQISAINTVARTLGCAPDDLPADPAFLRRRLASISPAMAGLTRGSWSSVRSRVLKALQRADIQVMPSRRRQPLSADWASLYRALPRNGWQPLLSRMIGYLSDRAISPELVCDGDVERFAWELETFSLRGRPTDIVRGAIRGWNAAVEQIPCWPSRPLTLPSRERKGYVLAAEHFSSAFRSSLAKYMAYLADPPDDDNAPFQGLRPVTLKLREFQFRQMASALVHSGVPVEGIGSVGDLASQASVDKICAFFAKHHGRSDAEQLLGLLGILRPVARYHLRDEALAQWIGRRSKRLLGGRGRQRGMTEKNRRRLAVFRDPHQVRRLLLLPFKLLKQAGTLRPKEAALLVRAAVAVELEIMCPIRLENLASINIDTDLVRSRTGKDGRVHLFIPGNRTKNGEDIELELPYQSASLIDVYIQKYRSQLIEPEHRGQGDRFLFPKPDGRAKTGKVLADHVCEVFLRELGIPFNMHLFRHLGCFLYLQKHPGQFDVMRRVLGHKQVETTMRFYAHIQQSDAFRLFDTHVLQIREDAMRPRRRDGKQR